MGQQVETKQHYSQTLFRMYSKYAETQGWKIEVMNANPTELGGYKEIVFMINGQGAYSKFKYESGAHRVQRVPETESQGRVHTSTSTVVVMPEAEEVELDLQEKIFVLTSTTHQAQVVSTSTKQHQLYV